MPPLKVMHRCPVWLPQTQAWLYHQIGHLPETVESHVVCDDVANLEQFAFPRVHVFKSQRPLRQLADRGLRKLGLREHLGLALRVARREHIDILHSHFGPVGWRSLPVARRARLPHVVSFYGADVGRYPRDPVWARRYRELFAAADRVLAEGPHMLDALAALGCPREKLRLHRLGMPLEEIAFTPRHRDVDTPLRLLIVAAFRPKKGIPLAIEALQQARAELGDFELTIIGDAGDEPDARAEKRRILEALEDTGLTDYTRLLGFQPYPRVVAEMYRHHLFLAPSIEAPDGDTEGGAPTTVIEMLASGMPGIASTHADLPSVLPARSGLTVPEGEATPLAEALVALAAAPERWPLIGADLRRHLEQRFDARRQGEALAGIYRELAG